MSPLDLGPDMIVLGTPSGTSALFQGNLNRSPASHDDSLHSEGLPDFGPDFDVDIPEIDRDVAPSAGDNFPDFGPTFPLEPSALFSSSVTSHTLSVLPQVASVSPADINAVASGEAPDFGPDFPVRPLDPMDADQSPDFGPNFEIVRADFSVEQLDAEVMPDFGPGFDGDIEMNVETTSHSNKSLAHRNIESGSSSHPLASLDRKSDAWFDTLQFPHPSTQEVLEAERPFDTAYADAIDKLSRVSDDIDRIRRLINYKEDTIVLLDKEIEDLQDQIRSRIPQSG
ncbi:hypothetical protein M405DRAFT_846646 [Rhizopogon salebrosus TDB-379]|nr:hypothetical protein M405DRAFT_846646 [Rhizopogon salebrosus TDB-379]